MARLGNILDYEKKKEQRKADAMPTVEASSPSVMPQAEVNTPALDKMTWKNTGIVPMAGQGEYRTEALRDMNEEQFKANQGKMNASDYEYWTEQLKANPGSEYVIVNQMLASKESPEEKAKRERREQLGEVFNNLGNLIGNAANLYYTHRGGQYIDLNTANEKHRERMQRIKDKQDALDRQREQIILNAKLGDAKTARAEAVAAKKADADAKAKDLQYKRDLALKQIDNAFKLGQIDAQTAANMKRDAAKATSDKELESIKQQNRIILKTTSGVGEGVRTSFTMPNGDIYTRATDLDDLEAIELAKYIKDPSPYTTTDSNGKVHRDYKRAAVDAVNSGSVPADVLIRMGYKKSGDSSNRSKKSNSFGYGKSKKEDGYDLNDI